MYWLPLPSVDSHYPCQFSFVKAPGALNYSVPSYCSRKKYKVRILQAYKSLHAHQAISMSPWVMCVLLTMNIPFHVWTKVVLQIFHHAAHHKIFLETVAGASVSCIRIIRENGISAHKWEIHHTYADYAKGICIPCRNQSRKAECGMLRHQQLMCVNGHPSWLLLLCACLHTTPKARQVSMLVWQKLASKLACKTMNMKICCILNENAFEGSAEKKHLECFTIREKLWWCKCRQDVHNQPRQQKPDCSRRHTGLHLEL